MLIKYFPGEGDIKPVDNSIRVNIMSGKIISSLALTAMPKEQLCFTLSRPPDREEKTGTALIKYEPD